MNEIFVIISLIVVNIISFLVLKSVYKGWDKEGFILTELPLFSPALLLFVGSILGILNVFFHWFKF